MRYDKIFMPIFEYRHVNLIFFNSCSERTVARRLKDLGLKGSGATTRDMPLSQKRQLVLDQLANDPSSQKGPRMIKELITHDTGVHLTR